MKKIATLFMIVCCFFICVTAHASLMLEYDGGIHNYTGSVYKLKVNGQELKNLPLSPIIFNDRAVVPVREVFEAMGATVTYASDNKTVKLTYEDVAVEIQINSNCAFVNDKTLKIPDDVTPKLIAKWGEDAKTMVPLRFITENLGLTVDFDGENGVISVSGKNQTKPNTPGQETPDETKPTVTPNTDVSPVKTNTITKISVSEQDGIVTITVSAKENISKMTNAVVTSGGVLYVDVENMTYTAPNKTNVNEDGVVKSVRLGTHENSTRIAIDTQNMKKHTEKISGKTVVFVITADSSADVTQKIDSVTRPDENTIAVPEEPTIPLINGKTPSELSKGVKYVILDAGHGGSDPGAIGNLMNDDELELYHEAIKSTEPIIDTMEAGTDGKINEKDIALKVVKKVKDKLESEGVKVILTRSGDTYPTLDERAELANNKGAAMFLSIHLNSTVNPVTAASGMEIYYSESNNSGFYGVTSKTMATTILKRATESAKVTSRGVKSGNLLVTRKTVMPASLIEIGFINNPDELNKMVTDAYQQKIADGIAKGILEVFGKITLP